MISSSSSGKKIAVDISMSDALAALCAMQGKTRATLIFIDQCPLTPHSDVTRGCLAAIASRWYRNRRVLGVQTGRTELNTTDAFHLACRKIEKSSGSCG